MRTNFKTAFKKSTPGTSSVLPQLISVIIPTYNCAQYITEALESVFNQDYPAYEVIVVDDGSTDNTQQVLEPYMNRIRYVYQENAGMSAALNHGIQLAKGELINFLDADDFFLLGKLIAQSAIFASDASVGAVHSGWRVVNHQGETSTEMTPWVETPQLDLDTWLWQKPINVCALLFRKTWLERVGGLDPELRQVNDLDLVLRLVLAGCKFTWLRRPTVAYRRHQGNITRNGLQQVQCVDIVLNKVFSNPDLPEQIRCQESKLRYFTLLSSAWHLFRADTLKELVSYLQKTVPYSPYQALEDTVLSWAVHFWAWGFQEEYSLKKLMTALPYFHSASALPPDQWQFLEALLCLGLTLGCYRNHLAKSSPVFYKLSALQGLPPRQLVEAIQKMMALGPGVPEVEQISMFWRDLCEQGNLPGLHHYDIASLYLTILGKAVLSRQWHIMLYSFKKIMTISWHPCAMRAWFRFLYHTFAYAIKRNQ